MADEPITEKTIYLLEQFLHHVRHSYPEFMTWWERHGYYGPHSRDDDELAGYARFGGSRTGPRHELYMLEQALDRIVELVPGKRRAEVVAELKVICDPLLPAIQETRERLGNLYWALLKDLVERGDYEATRLFRQFVSPQYGPDEWDPQHGALP